MTRQTPASPAARPLYARANLPQLKQRDRAGVFKALGSFDARGLDDDAFVRQAVTLLDPARVPGLTDALAANDLAAMQRAVLDACRHKVAESKTAISPSTRATANAVLEHRFSFYDETHNLPEKINWDTNPGTAHWAHDLNRFTYLTPLTQTFLATGDTRYSRKAVTLILDWIDACDFARAFSGTPYAFGSYLNLAIHASAWSRTIDTLCAHDQVSASELLRILKSLHDHLAYLEIVTNGHAGNWPTIGCMGLLATLERFALLRDTSRFSAYCRNTLAKQIAAQVLPDGVQNELTPHYHRVVINNLVSASQSLRALQSDLTPETLATLRAMVHYSQQTIMPDGSKIAAFNDSDPGAVPDLYRQFTDADMAEMLRPADQLGPEVYPYAGVAFLRQRQDQGDLYLAFDAGPFGSGHQHEDKLSFWLFAYGRNFVVDPGRHLYDQSAASFRPYLISTRAHSTILIDGLGQNSRGRPQTWVSRKPLDLGWQADADEVRARGSYDLGYGPKNDTKVTHWREIVFVKQRYWVIFDVVTGVGEHAVESRFQFAPGDLILDGVRARTDFADANLLLWPHATLPITETHIEKGQQQPRGGWYSDSYNKIEPAPALSLNLKGPLPVAIATLLFPYRGRDIPDVHFTFDGDAATLHTADLGEITVQRSPSTATTH